MATELRSQLTVLKGEVLTLAYPRALALVGVAVKDLKLSYYIGETLLFTIYIPIMVT